VYILDINLVKKTKMVELGRGVNSIPDLALMVNIGIDYLKKLDWN